MTMRSASETRFPPLCFALKSFWMPSSLASTVASVAGWFTSHCFCGSRRMRAPFAPPRLSEPRNVDADAHAVDTRSAVESPEARIVALSERTSAASISG